MKYKLTKWISMVVTLGMLAVTIHASESTKPLTFDFKSTKGQSITIEETASGFKFSTLKGKNVVAIFYIHRQPCKDAIRVLSDAQKRHSNLEIIGFDLVDSDDSVLNKFAAEQKAENIIYINKKQSTQFANYIAPRAQWPGTVPFIIIVNDKGEVKHMQLGGIPTEKFDELYKKVM